MRQLAKDLKALLLGKRLNLVVAGVTLVALLAATPLILKGESLFSSNPLKHLASGAMAKFLFKHQGTPAPGVVFEGPEGEMTLARLRGRALLVNLWASWCQPCVKELPSLDRLQASMGGARFQVVAIDMDQDKNDALYFLAKNRIHHLPLYFDPNLLMSIAWQEEGIPVSVLYDTEGHEVGRYVGGTNWDSPEAKNLIKAAIESPESK